MKLYFGCRDLKKKEVNVLVRELTPEEEDAQDVNFDNEKHKLFHRVYHSPDGFEWGYGGSGPADLALSILYDHFDQDWEKAWSYHQIFKQVFVARIKEDAWVISTYQIQCILEKLGMQAPTRH